MFTDSMEYFGLVCDFWKVQPKQTKIALRRGRLEHLSREGACGQETVTRCANMAIRAILATL